MKRTSFAAVVLTVACASSLAACSSSDSGSKSAGGSDNYVIATSLIAPVDVLNAELKAFKTELAAKGLDDVTYVDTNAQGQVSNVELVVKQMLDKKPDLIFAIGTPLNVSLAQKTTTTPLIFGAMTDPVGAKVVSSLDKPGANSTGATDAIPAKTTVDTVKQVVPEVKTIGIIGNPSEQNTQSFIKQVQEQAKLDGIAVKTAPITNTNDATLAVKSLSGHVEAILIPADNTAVNALPTISQEANQAKLPTFMAAGPDFAKQGVTVAFGVDYSEFGKQCADYAYKILKDGAKPGDLPVVGLETGTAKLAVAVNPASVKALGLQVPSDWEGQ